MSDWIDWVFCDHISAQSELNCQWGWLMKIRLANAELVSSFKNTIQYISEIPLSSFCYDMEWLGQPRWLSGLRRSRVHSLWLLVDHSVLRNWDRILVRAVKGLISRAGMVSICPLLWQRDVKLQQTKHGMAYKSLCTTALICHDDMDWLINPCAPLPWSVMMTWTGL